MSVDRPGVHIASLARPVDDASEVVRDLFETLAIDLADVQNLGPGFDVVTLPRWALYQDDRGVQTAIATFTGLRKAETVLGQFESTQLQTNQPQLRHWLDPVLPIEGAARTMTDGVVIVD